MKKRATLLFAFAPFFGACSGDLPLSDLINNTITLKVLGTYESNDPYPDLATTMFRDDIIQAGTGISGSNAGWNDLSEIYTYANTLSISRVKYYIDIAEVRIAQGQGKSSSQTIADYWSQLAISRQLLCSDYNSSEAGRELVNCRDSNGAQRLTDFFNGGFSYPAVDVATGNYNHLGIYFRRLNTYPAAFFNNAGKFATQTGADTTQDLSEQSVTSTFDNRTISGLDLESFLQNQHGQTATEPLMFPLQRKDLSISVTNGAEPYVLEVRVFLKNLMMAHVREITVNSVSAGLVFVGPSDWNINHSFKDLDNSNRMGGSVLLTARTYQPAKVGTIQLNNVITTTAKSYYTAVTQGTTFTTTIALPLAATAATAGAQIKNLPAGSYEVYRTCDIQQCNNATSAAGGCTLGAGKDGFPEVAQSCGVVTVTTGTTTPLDVAGCAIAGCT